MHVVLGRILVSFLWSPYLPLISLILFFEGESSCYALFQIRQTKISRTVQSCCLFGPLTHCCLPLPLCTNHEQMIADHAKSHFGLLLKVPPEISALLISPLFAIPLVCKPHGEVEVFGHRFASSSNSASYSTPPCASVFSTHHFTPFISTREILLPLSERPQTPGRDGIPSAVPKICALELPTLLCIFPLFLFLGNMTNAMTPLIQATIVQGM